MLSRAGLATIPFPAAKEMMFLSGAPQLQDQMVTTFFLLMMVTTLFLEMLETILSLDAEATTP